MISVASIGLIAQAGAGAAPAFSYNDIPNQLLRIDAAAGFTLSGTDITAIADQSSAGETITITDAPQYTASDANLNGEPSFIPSGISHIDASAVDATLVRFFATVFYVPDASTYWILSNPTSGGTPVVMRRGIGELDFGVTGVSLTALGEASAGRKRLLAPIDGTADFQWNGTAVSSITEALPGTGLRIAGPYSTGTPVQMAWFMACSAVPSAPLLAALEANLLARYG